MAINSLGRVIVLSIFAAGACGGVVGTTPGPKPDPLPEPPPCDLASCNATCVGNGFASGRCDTYCFCKSAETVGGCEQTPPVGCYESDPETFGVGRCRAGGQVKYIIGDEPPTNGPCQGEITPQGEVCNGLDDNCNGVADEGLDCSDPLDPVCGPNSPCSSGVCAEVGVNNASCVTPDPCDPVSNNGCEAGTECEAFGTITRCWEPPKTTCLAHFWYMAVRDEVQEGGHFDTGMNCVRNEPTFKNGSQCTTTPNGDDVQIRCEGTVSGMMPRKLSGWSHDFLALDFPIQAPAGITRCLVAWGVHPLIEKGKAVSPDGHQMGTVTAFVGGGAAATEPVTAGGLTTKLPAAAFQHIIVDRPAMTTVPIPTKKEERGARIYWNDPSVAELVDQPLHVPYSGCRDCSTYRQLIEHVYPGPEIFLQGLSRDPADSQFVIPFWLPYYDAVLQTQNVTILAEMVCLAQNGEIHRTVSASGILAELPATAPTPGASVELPPWTSDVCEPPKTPVIY